MVAGYTPRELARAAGFLIRRVDSGGAVLREYPYGRVLELGPDATDDAIEQLARPFLVLPMPLRIVPEIASLAEPAQAG